MTTAGPTAASVLRTVLAVGGMHCDSCARHVETALTTLDGVTAQVDVAASSASVTHPVTVSVQQLIALVEDAGYTVEVGGRAASP